MITLYTDGSAHLADMSGGWAWWVSDDLWDAGYVTPATNQRMEMMAVLFGLSALAWHGQPVKVVSDSAYVINCFQQRWYLKWQQNVDLEGNWRSANGKKVVATPTSGFVCCQSSTPTTDTACRSPGSTAGGTVGAAKKTRRTSLATRRSTSLPAPPARPESRARE